MTVNRLAFAIFGVALALGTTPLAAQEFTARIGHLESDQQPRHAGLVMVADLVKERTGGAVAFELFPAGQLGQAREMNEGVQLGLIEGTVSPAAFLAGFNPAVSILDVPFLYPSDREKAAALRGGAFGDAVLASFEPLGFHAVALWPNGRKAMTSNNEIANVEDFAGQRFRVMDSAVLIEQFNAVGASAIALPFGELYTALQTGVVDGQENALDTIATMKYQEVQQHLLISEHGANEDVVLFNPGWWNSLPAEYQDIIVAAFDEVRPQVEQIKEAAQATALETIKQSGIDIVELDDAQRAAFREVMYGPARDAYLAGAGDAGKTIVDVYEAQYAEIVGQ
ncbi:TRAP transporter substrate-binding protein [Devosia sp. Root635]|uniref:TRAP transporter substrate-binding protein n=1 Tax=Devosia sp. Root635 TaxID=1736575 RepID=UPI0006F99DDB|nr:TRAP transporter substrate-binding protein [Devosia sp. Root635]KRA40241.1 C4-dicarboxylate ABC transporter substrate-binding protein [Devosia sp. Root635]